jgi:hypothetical protein
MSCSLIGGYQRFGGTHRFYLQGKKLQYTQYFISDFSVSFLKSDNLNAPYLMVLKTPHESIRDVIFIHLSFVTSILHRKLLG